METLDIINLILCFIIACRCVIVISKEAGNKNVPAVQGHTLALILCFVCAVLIIK